MFLWSHQVHVINGDPTYMVISFELAGQARLSFHAQLLLTVRIPSLIPRRKYQVEAQGRKEHRQNLGKAAHSSVLSDPVLVASLSR